MSDREINERILFLYLRDSDDPEHVATLARYKNGNMLTFAWAVNKITYEHNTVREGKTVTHIAKRTVHDTFSKKRGRTIAEGRLSCERSSITLELEDGEHPLRAVLETLAYNEAVNDVVIPLFLSRVAMEALEAYDEEQISLQAERMLEGLAEHA